MSGSAKKKGANSSKKGAACKIQLIGQASERTTFPQILEIAHSRYRPLRSAESSRFSSEGEQTLGGYKPVAEVSTRIDGMLRSVIEAEFAARAARLKDPDPVRPLNVRSRTSIERSVAVWIDITGAQTVDAFIKRFDALMSAPVHRAQLIKNNS